MRGLSSLIYVPVIGAVFWVLILRPAKARSRAALLVQEQVLPGAQVVTTSGLYAGVVEVGDEVIVLETAPGVTSRWARGAVGRVLPPPDVVGDASSTPTPAAGPPPGAGHEPGLGAGHGPEPGAPPGAADSPGRPSP